MICKPQKPLTEEEQIINNTISEEHKQCLIKMVEIRDALLYGGCELNFFNYKDNYSLDFFKIMIMLEDDKKDYSDIVIMGAINKLHKKMFKNRRY
jgi:hypothetical protein